ncbi:hypothetical protein [Sphingomonas profundi]|uniref:hypothetical protein n=1 Tax=Alterirhizorhabdus profundi TaxID=2681549 RepID=UPI0012E8FF02|nr:hypothetical protein [Sphingomonas profundi]
MDLGFTRLDALRCDAAAPLPLDYVRLVASLAAMQSATRTAAVEARLSTGTFDSAHPIVALVKLLAAGPGWASSVTTLGGSFHPALAATNRGFRPREPVNGIFTLRG